MATHKGHFRWYNEEEVYGKKQWTRVYFVLQIEERALYIYKQKKEQAKEWKKVDLAKGKCENGHHEGKKHVFVFTANGQAQYVFRSEHKNKKKQWVRYLNEAAADAAHKVETPKAEEKKPEPVKEEKKEEEEDSSSSDSDSSSSDESSSSEDAEAAAAAKKKAEEEAERQKREAEAEAEAARKKKEADEEAEAARKKKEAEDAAAAAAAAAEKQKEAEKEEEESSDSSSDSSSSDSESEAEAEPKAAEPVEVGKNVTVENTFPRLLHLQGKKKTDITITHVPASAASVNDSDVFILDNNKTVYTWLGASPNMWQKQAAATLTRAIDDERGSDVANTVISNLSGSDAAKFWELLGGKPEQLSKAAPEGRAPVLFQLSDASGKMEFAEVGRGNPLKRSLLNSNDVFIADLGFHIFVWIGKKASRDERDKAVGYAVNYRQQFKRPEYIHVERVMDGGENEILYSFFIQ